MEKKPFSCGGIFKRDLIANLLPYAEYHVPMKW